MPRATASSRRERLDDVVDRPARDPGRIEGRDPVRGGPPGEDRREDAGGAPRGSRPGRRSWQIADPRRAPGRPSAAQRRGHCRSDPTATASAPSDVSKVSYGTMFGWALPSRPGAAPDTNAFWAWLTRLASVAPRIETSTRWPWPEAGPASRSRPASAPSSPTAPSIPVRMSLIATPTFVGLPPSASAAPVIDIRPLTAWTMKS